MDKLINISAISHLSQRGFNAVVGIVGVSVGLLCSSEIVNWLAEADLLRFFNL